MKKANKKREKTNMTYTIVTSTTSRIKSTQSGITFYTVSAQEFLGIQTTIENGRNIERNKLGSLVVLYTTRDAKLATTFIKNIKKSGTLAEVG